MLKGPGNIKDAVIGALVGALVIGLIGAAFYFFLRQRRRRTQRLKQEKAADKDHKEFDPTLDAASTRPPTSKGPASIHSYYMVDGELPADGREIFQLDVEERPLEIGASLRDAISRRGMRHELNSPLSNPLPVEAVEINGKSRVGRETLTVQNGSGNSRTPSPLGRNVRL
jgi:hypothetical protein